MNEKEYTDIVTQSVCIDENNVAWFFSHEYNALLKKRMPDGEVEYITSFENEGAFVGSLYNYAIYDAGMIAFIPVIAKEIALYDTASGEVTYLPREMGKALTHFNTFHIEPHKLLLFPVQFREYAYILDMKEKALQKISLDFGKMKDHFRSELENSVRHFEGNGYDGNCAYMAIAHEKKYLVYHVTENRIEIFDYTDGDLCAAGGNKKGIYFLERNGQWIYSAGKRMCIPANEFRGIVGFSESMAYTHICNIGEECVIVMPVYGNPVTILQNEQLKLIELNKNNYHITKDIPQPFVSVVKGQDENYYLFPYQSDKIVGITKGGEVFYEPLQITGEHLKSMGVGLLKLNKGSDTITYETPLVGLDSFLSCVKDMQEV